MKLITILLSLHYLLVASACTEQSVWRISQNPSNAFSSSASSAIEDGGIVIINEGSSVEVVHAAAIARPDDTLISLTVERKNYQPLPTGAHIDILAYNRDGELIESITKIVRSHEFRRRANGRYLPAHVNEYINSDRSIIGRIEIHSYYNRHKDHI